MHPRKAKSENANISPTIWTSCRAPKTLRTVLELFFMHPVTHRINERFKILCGRFAVAFAKERHLSRVGCYARLRAQRLPLFSSPLR